MTWKYSVSTGRLTHNEVVISSAGYSGTYGYINRPECEEYSDRGPIPAGKYKIGSPFKRGKQKEVMHLYPVGHKAHGRDGFLIHGDKAGAYRAASTGCIILPAGVRHRISASGDKDLQVVP